MTNYKYLVILMTLIGIVIGQRFAGKRINSKFRPNAEWFEEMQGSSLPSDFEQSDQPPQEDDIAFRDFFVEDFEPMETEVREGKFPRGTAVAKKVEVFQNICPYINKTIVPSDTDPDYEFIPHVYQEIVCAYPYQQQSRLMFDQKKNFVCHSDRGFNCVQLTSSIFLLKRRHGTKCWEPEIRKNVPTDCSCLWPKHLLGDILHAHLNFNLASDQQQ